MKNLGRSEVVEMIDFIKVNLPRDTLNTLENNQELDFKTLVSRKTGECGDRDIAEVRGLKFIAHSSGYLQLHGSLHKFWNDGMHNYNDFTFTDLQEVLGILENTFGVDLTNSRLSNIEFGVNIQPPVPVSQVLDNLVYHRGRRYEVHSLKDGDYRQVKHQRYLIKVYDKSQQYQTLGVGEDNILRFELKFVKMEDLLALGIRNLVDLQDRKVFAKMKRLLIDKWNETFYYDTTVDTKLMTNSQRIKLLRWQNSNFWLNLDKESRLMWRKQYDEVVKNYSQSIGNKIARLIESKWDCLISSRSTTYEQGLSLKTSPINHSYIRLISDDPSLDQSFISKGKVTVDGNDEMVNDR